MPKSKLREKKLNILFLDIKTNSTQQRKLKPGLQGSESRGHPSEGACLLPHSHAHSVGRVKKIA